MKKVLLIALGFFAFTANAQEDVSYKPTTGTVTTEVGLTGGLNNANFNLNGGALKFRYFLKEDLAVRAGLGIDNEKEEFTSTVNTPFTVNGVRNTKNSNNSLKLGIEKHFAGSSRLSTYAGADLIVSFGNTSDEIVAENENYIKRNQKNSSFGFAVFTGADYYIAPKVFLGVEAGLNFISEKTKEGDLSTKQGNNFTDTKIAESKGSDFASNVFGGIRIGFQF